MLQGCRVHNPSEVGELVAPPFFENRFNGLTILTDCGMMTPHELMFHDTTVLLVSAPADTTTLTTTFGSAVVRNSVRDLPLCLSSHTPRLLTEHTNYLHSRF